MSFLLLTPALSTNQLVSLQGRVLQSGTPLSGGSLAVTIWSAIDNGTLLYSDNFTNSINDGFFDLMLGSSSELNLTYGTFYYLDVSINGEDANWTSPSGGTVNRIQFQSQNGQIPPSQVQYNAINASSIQPNSINATHILGSAITAAKMAFNAINSSHIIDNAITTAKIVNDAITSAKIAPQAVNSSHLNSAGTYYMGKLGIGTTGPSADLEIKSSSSIGAINVTNGTGYPVLFVNASSQKVSIGTTNPITKFQVNVGTNQNLNVRSSNSMVSIDSLNDAGSAFANMRMEAAQFHLMTGNVGIGTTSPKAALHIATDQTGNTTLGTSNQLILANTHGGTGERVEIGMGYKGNSANQPVTVGHIVTSSTANSKGDFYIATRDVTTDTAPTERLYITSSGNVGINTTSPTEKLVVVGDGGTDGRVATFRTGSDNSYITLGNIDNTGVFINNIKSAGKMTFGVHTVGPIMAMTATGLYIGGSTSPSYALQLASDSAAKPSTNTWTISSDARVKKDIRPFTDGLSVIEKIDPVWYRYNGLGGFKADGRDYIGVIGQDIQKAAPYTVNTYRAKLNPGDANETELLNFNSHALTFVLINSVKELKAENGELKAENSGIKARLAALEATRAG